MVGSLDVSALYPSLDQEQSADMVCQMIQDARMEGIKLRKTQVYLASCLSPQQVKREGLGKLLPARAKKGGNKPGPTTDKLARKHPAPVQPGDKAQTEQLSKWLPTNPDKELSEPEKRLLVAKAIKYAIITIFHNHVYQFGGKRFRQTLGGPIGLRLTSLVARVVMDRWALSFLGKIDRAGVKVWAMVKYVDDINIVINVLDNNLVWDGDELRSIESQGEVPGEKCAALEGTGVDRPTSTPRAAPAHNNNNISMTQQSQGQDMSPTTTREKGAALEGTGVDQPTSTPRAAVPSRAASFSLVVVADMPCTESQPNRETQQNRG